MGRPIEDHGNRHDGESDPAIAASVPRCSTAVAGSLQQVPGTNAGNLVSFRAMIPKRLNWLTMGAPAELAQLFTEAGHEIYLVGGSVRDALLGRQSPDLDFTTDARPDAIKTLVRDWADDLYTMGETFGTIGAIKDDVHYEITTFRHEVYLAHSRKTLGDLWRFNRAGSRAARLHSQRNGSPARGGFSGSGRSARWCGGRCH